jgi:hypothetical protein
MLLTYICSVLLASPLQDERVRWDMQLLDPSQPLGPQNEAAALSRLLAAGPTGADKAALHQLCNTFAERTSLAMLQGGPVDGRTQSALVLEVGNGGTCDPSSAEAKLQT